MYEPFYIKDGKNFVQILFEQVLYVESKDKYSIIITTTRTYLIRLPLNTVERLLPSRYFCRINRSQIVPVLRTTLFNNVYAIVGQKKLLIGKKYKEALRKRVVTFTNDPKSFIPLSDYDMLNLLRGTRIN